MNNITLIFIEALNLTARDGVSAKLVSPDAVRLTEPLSVSSTSHPLRVAAADIRDNLRKAKLITLDPSYILTVVLVVESKSLRAL